MDEIKDKALVAFRAAVRNYKPWIAPNWNSIEERDSFWQIVQGAENNGFLTSEKACEQFGITPEQYAYWKERGCHPDRNMRKKVWSFLKKELGL